MGSKETLLTTKEFASQSGLTVEQVTRMLREKQLQGHKQSGRWMIPAGQLQAGKKAREQPAAKPAAQPSASSPSAPAQVLSVADFSAKTYLTENGVIQWLKRGRLHGRQAAGGEWVVDAASLELPVMRHLLRR